jgi:hypothetical protein
MKDLWDVNRGNAVHRRLSGWWMKLFQFDPGVLIVAWGPLLSPRKLPLPDAVNAIKGKLRARSGVRGHYQKLTISHRTMVGTRHPCTDTTAVNSLQCLSRSFDVADYGTTHELGLRWRFGPDLSGLIDCDVIPYDARAIMLSQRMGENSIWVPILLYSRIMNAAQGDGRGCAQVRCQHRLPNYERTKMRVCLFL